MTTDAVNRKTNQRERSFGFLWGNTSKLNRREAIDGFLMALPWILGFLLFTAGPMLAAIYFSLTKWDIISTPQVCGIGQLQHHVQ